MCPAALNNQVHTLSRRLRSSRGRPTGDQAVGLLSKAFPEDCVQDLQVIASATHGANFIRHFWTTASAIRFSLDITASIAQANLLIPERLLDFSRRSHAAGRRGDISCVPTRPIVAPGKGGRSSLAPVVPFWWFFKTRRSLSAAGHRHWL
jgi:hypothetical protein